MTDIALSHRFLSSSCLPLPEVSIQSDLDVYLQLWDIAGNIDREEEVWQTSRVKTLHIHVNFMKNSMFAGVGYFHKSRI